MTLRFLCICFRVIFRRFGNSEQIRHDFTFIPEAQNIVLHLLVNQSNISCDLPEKGAMRGRHGDCFARLNCKSFSLSTGRVEWRTF